MPLGATKVGLLAAAGSSAGGVPDAYGGIITQYTDSGTTYRVHTFRGTGTLAVTTGGEVTYLLVGGGGTTLSASASNLSFMYRMSTFTWS